jgi:MoaA/NifB/PqqE/SkfB family radical SAM enzyme
MNIFEIIKGLNKNKKNAAITDVPAGNQEDRDKPDFCVIEVTHRCMFACQMCNYWQTGVDPEEVTIPQLRNFISSLTDFISSPLEMNISGGEPLLKEGIMDLVEFMGKKGIRFSMVTNGYLINKEYAHRIAHSGLTVLAISLDSISARVHDLIRGRAGAHQKVIEAIEYLNRDRGRLQNIVIQTILMQQNLDGIPALIKWANEKQLSISFMAVCRPNMLAVDPLWYKKEEYGFLWPHDYSQVRETIDMLIDYKSKGYKIDNPTGQLEKFKLYFEDPDRFVRETPCSLGDKIIHVNPHGQVYLCCEMESIGTIKSDSISKIWNSQKAKDIRQKIRQCRRNCAGMVNCYREGFKEHEHASEK